MRIGQSADKSYAYLVGVYLGDGCVTKQAGYPVFRLNTIDQDFADAVKLALEDLTEYKVGINKHSVKLSSKPNYALRCGSPQLCEALQEDTDRKEKLPEFIWQAPRDHQLAFIAGLMDSEGYVGKNSNPTNRSYYLGFKSCDNWVPEFARLLQIVGVRIGKVGIEKPYKVGYKTPTRFTIKIQSWINAGCYFNILRKSERIAKWNEAGPYERRAKFPRRLISETTRQAA